MLSTENIASDVFHGCFVVTCTLFAFIGLVWLREQILHGGGPDWLERDNNNVPPPAGDILPPRAHPPAPNNNNVLEPDLQQGINQVSRTILHRMSVHATFCLHNALKAIDGKWLSLCYSLATSSLAVAAIACSCGGFRIKWHISVRPDNV